MCARRCRALAAVDVAQDFDLEVAGTVRASGCPVDVVQVLGLKFVAAARADARLEVEPL